MPTKIYWTAVCRQLAWLLFVAATMCASRAIAVADDSSDVAATAGRKMSRVRTADVCLNSEHRLLGRVVDPQGRPLRGESIELWQAQRRVAASTTDETGRFAVSGVAPGVYQIFGASTWRVVRAWSAGTAPPAAQSTLLLIDGPVVRGQNAWGHQHPAGGVYGGAVMRTLSNPWVFSGLVGAGIAVPIAISQDNAGDGS